MLVVSGYQAFPEYLSKSTNIKVKLNHKVTSVTFQEEEGKSVVKCANGKVY